MKRLKSKTSHSPNDEKHCFFCVQSIESIDYKDTYLLRGFVSSYGKIAPKKRSHACTKHQRKLASAIKRARTMALMSPTQR